MQLTARELATAIHGMLFGGLFLMACFGALALLVRSQMAPSASESSEAVHRWDRAYLIVMVLLGWGAVLSGTWLVYPWYRAAVPAGVANLAGYPQRLLLSSPGTRGWHELGMEWKEHVAWFAPILMTMVAWVLIRYRKSIDEHRKVRATVMAFAGAALLAAGIAGVFGAFLNKKAPVDGGRVLTLRSGT
ncbi:MAG TPA: hypothetical protein VHZ25_16155 [Acidobacteriaceae bacterium]|jgi:hypothetical protein|nr:hypothetical protein [Acidobacteriaceae bacterium]